MISSFASPSSSSSPSPASSVVVRVEKATSELLIGPDWTLNIDICDTINYNHWLAKDVVKSLKKRLQHKNPKVQLLSLTLLETMVKNCGEKVHFQIAERNILQDMVKIVKKKTDMHVRDKILALLDSWQEAFGGPGGKYSQYYWAYDELRRSGVQFPQRSYDEAPIFTPPATHPGPRPRPGYGMPNNSSTRLDEAMAAEMETLSLSTISSMGDVLDLLADMLQAVNTDDRTGVKDEVIVDLVDRCRANQKKLMQMLTTTGDEKLLAQGLELNDRLQSVLAKHDAIASGAVFPNSFSAINQPSTEIREVCEGPNAEPDGKALAPLAKPIDEEEDEDDDFAQLARRHSKPHPQMMSQATNSALVLVDPPAPVKTTKEEDIIELLSLTLSDASPHAPQTPPAQDINQRPVSPINQEISHSYTAPESYVAPWAKPQAHSQLPPQPPLQQMPQSTSGPQGQPQPHFPHYSAYPPPPWAATPGYFSNPNPTPHVLSTPAATTDNSLGKQANSVASVGSYSNTAAAQKTFIPSYRLFEDLNVFGNDDQKPKTTSSAMSGK